MVQFPVYKMFSAEKVGFDASDERSSSQNDMGFVSRGGPGTRDSPVYIYFLCLLLYFCKLSNYLKERDQDNELSNTHHLHATAIKLLPHLFGL